MGRPAPGHEVTVLDAAADGEGDIAVKRGSASMMLGYWQRPEATAAKFRGDWMVTGDRGALLPSGAIRFVGRDDDVITSAGYRIGPAEVEDALITHAAVASAGVVGQPDPDRTEIVVAFVVLRDRVVASDALAAELQAHVKARAGAHEYPRRVIFVDSLPMTVTGKIRRGDLRAMLRDGT
jgi:acetyl-CoA synthetase